MQRKIFTIFSTALLTCALLLAGAQIRTTVEAEGKSKAAAPTLQAGEKLVYSVKWNELAAAKVIMATERAAADKVKDTYRLDVQVNTIGMVKDLVQVNDRFTAYVYAANGLPFRAERDIVEGPKVEQASVVYDQEKHTVTVADNKPIAILPETHDIASLFWAIRNIKLPSGATEKLQAFNSAEKKLFVAQIEVGQREDIATAAGKFSAIQYAIKLQDGKQLSDKNEIRMWVTDDERRLPVLITAQPPFGKVRMELSNQADSEDEATGNNDSSK
jgi:hypothetical protein